RRGRVTAISFRVDRLRRKLYHHPKPQDHPRRAGQEPPRMKAERRKEIETNSLVLLVQRWRQHVSSRSLYYLVGTVALIIAIVFLWRYLAGESRRARDAILVELQTADTVEKLKDGMERHRGTIWGSFFKAQLARHKLRAEGLPRLGTDRDEAR